MHAVPCGSRGGSVSGQAQLYHDYVHDQCLEAIQIIMHENRIAAKNYTATPYALMKNKESRKSGSENPRSKRVCKLSMDGELLCIYESMNQAAQENNTFHASISKCCSHENQLFHAGGFRWCLEYYLTSFMQRCRFQHVMKQLLATVARHDAVVVPKMIPSRSDDTKKKIGETMKEYFETDAGKQNKKQAHQKRSETMNERREQIRASITEKECRICKKILPVTIFSKKSAATDGLQPYLL